MLAYLRVGSGPKIAMITFEVRVPPVRNGPVEEAGGFVPLF